MPNQDGWNGAAYELEALAKYHEDSGEPFTPEAMRQLARKWRAAGEQAGQMPDFSVKDRRAYVCLACATSVGDLLREPLPEMAFFHGACVGKPEVRIVEDYVAKHPGKSHMILRTARLEAAGVRPGYRFFHSAGDFAGRECVLQKRGGWGIDKEPPAIGGPAKGFCAMAHPICTCAADEDLARSHLYPCDLWFEERGQPVPIYPPQLEIVHDVNLDGWHEWCQAHGRDPDPEAMREWLSELSGEEVTMSRVSWDRPVEKVYMPGEYRPTVVPGLPIATYEEISAGTDSARPVEPMHAKPHPFDPGWSAQSVTCNQLVERDGAGDDCKLPREHPVHDV